MRNIIQHCIISFTEFGPVVVWMQNNNLCECMYIVNKEGEREGKILGNLMDRTRRREQRTAFQNNLVQSLC